MADRRSKIFWVLLAGLVAVGAFVVWRVSHLNRPSASEAKPAEEAKGAKEADAPIRLYDGPSYSAPEDLTKDHKRAFEYAGGAHATARLFLADYHACRALQARSPAACKEFDAWNSPAGITPPCAHRYYISLLLKSAFSRSPSVQACLDWLAVPAPLDASSRKACEAALPLVRQGDHKAICEGAVQAGALRSQDRGQCEMDLSFLTGDPSVCAKLPDHGAHLGCESMSLLVKALREDKPELLKGSPFASIMGVSEDEPCKAAGQVATESYQRDAMEVFNVRTKWDAKVYKAEQEQREKQGKAQKVVEAENAKNEALLREAEAKRLAFQAQSGKALEEERKLAEERRGKVEEWLSKEENAKVERAAKREQQEKLKFETARQADELRRRKSNLSMQDDPPTGPPKRKPKAKAAQEPGADAIMISSEKEEEESQ